MFNLEDLKKLVDQIATEMEHSPPKVVINNRFKTRTLARASWNPERELIEFNKITLEFLIDDLIDLIRHEMFHLVLKAGDSDPKFQMACRLNGVKLNGDKEYDSAPSPKPFKYQIICESCGKKYQKYHRMAGYAKRVKDNPQDFFCHTCGKYGQFKVIELKGGK